MAHSHLNSIVAALTLAMTSAWAAGASGQITWYVDADAPPGGDGLGWSSAFDDLQPAMELALPGDEIWVAEGVYVPSVIDPIAGEDQPYFLMPDGVAILGGFRGDETSADQRDPTIYESIISGDLLGNDLDVPVTGGYQSSQEMTDLYMSLLDNTGTLLFVDRTGPGTRLDGLVFQDAYTDREGGGYAPSKRNGVFVLGAILDIANCTFRENRGGPNAAIYAVACEAQGLDTDFAAMHPCGLATLGQPSAITIVDSAFIDNIDNFGEGGLGTIGATVLLRDTLFVIDNVAVEFSRTTDIVAGSASGLRAGQPGIWATGDSEGVIMNSRFERCSSSVSSRGTPSNNSVSAIGVGLGSGRTDFADVDIIGCEFVNNQASPYGLIRYWGGGGRVQDNLFLGNRYYEEIFASGASGAVIGVVGTSSPRPSFVAVNQNVFVGNGQFDLFGDDPERPRPIVNSWAWTSRVYNNTFAANFLVPASSGFDTVFVQTSSGQDALVAGTIDTNSAMLDPLFQRNPDDGGDGWGDDPFTPDVDESVNDDYGDLRLRPGSPAIDVGVLTTLIFRPGDFDLDGNERSVDDPGLPDGFVGFGGVTDLGAYEFQGVTCLPDVNQDGMVMPSDFNAWILAYNAGSPLADQNRDGAVTPSDFNAWILNYNNAIANGCP